MKHFRFSLAAVLTLRQRAENAALKTYAEALLAREKAVARVDEIHRELGEHWKQIRGVFALPCAAGKIEQLRHHAAFLETELARSESALKEVERVLSAALQKMLAARQQRQAIDNFRDNQRAHYDRELIREEHKFLDDLARRPGLAAPTWKLHEGD